MQFIDDREYLTPPDNEAKEMFRCFLCGNSIYVEDTCFKVNGLKYCKECVEENTAELEDIEGYIADLEYHDIE